MLAIWLVVCLATLDYNGPFYDEGIYVTAGLRTLQGHGLVDGYLRWFAGSLLWPQMAGAAFRLGGLLLVRALAALFAASAFAGVVQAARNLFGDRAAFWTAVSLAVSGPLLALARLGVYDLPACPRLSFHLYRKGCLLRGLGLMRREAQLTEIVHRFDPISFGQYPQSSCARGAWLSSSRSRRQLGKKVSMRAMNLSL